MAYAIEVEHQIITVATDLGEVCPELQDAMRHAACAVIESNHDEQLLAAGSYPPYLKERIRSSTGHLSNRQTANALSLCGKNGLKHVVLAHLSEENNDPSLAHGCATSALCNETVAVHLTAQGVMGPFLTL
jgi:phosphoribosyl 1,2-cyclic phosphodiesterase